MPGGRVCKYNKKDKKLHIKLVHFHVYNKFQLFTLLHQNYALYILSNSISTCTQALKKLLVLKILDRYVKPDN